MASESTMAFARNAAGQIVSAIDLPSLGPAHFHCAACGEDMSLRRPGDRPAFFEHTRVAGCENGVARAVHAAALEILVESRFVEAPPPNQSGSGSRNRPYIEEWGNDVSIKARVDGVAVDMYAETLAGPLIVQVAVKPLYDVGTRASIRALGHAALEITIVRPNEIATVGDLRKAVLRGITNKFWLWHPAIANRPRRVRPEPRPVEMALFGGVERSASRLSVPVAPSSWLQAGDLAKDAAFRQSSVSEKIELLEEQIGERCDRWSDVVDVVVPGDEGFGVDSRLWKADVFNRFVQAARQQAATPDVAVQSVFGRLCTRYPIPMQCEDAARAAVGHFLRRLAALGYLRDLADDRFRVLPQQQSDDGVRLRWHPEACLTVSTLRVCAEKVRLEIPVRQVQRLLDYFEDGRPSIPVAAFVEDSVSRLRAPARTIIAFLREAHLID